jgi:hypothetical protein
VTGFAEKGVVTGEAADRAFVDFDLVVDAFVLAGL